MPAKRFESVSWRASATARPPTPRAGRIGVIWTPRTSRRTGRPAARTAPAGAPRGAAERVPVARGLDQRADEAGHGERDRGDDQRLEDDAELGGEPARQAGGLARDLDADPDREHRDPEDRRQADRLGERGPAVTRPAPAPAGAPGGRPRPQAPPR